MKLTCKPLLEGIMAYWEEVPEAADYIVILYINNTPISTKNVERGELYYSFKGLAAIDGQTGSTVYGAAYFGRNICGVSVAPPQHSGSDYCVQVQAENRKGEIIAVSERVKCKVKEF